jgi:hypothetical protein
MMKKYNKPEIVTLALDTVDVIETSGARFGDDVSAAAFKEYKVQAIEQDINTMSNTWSW